jgi:spore germination cell wall hydrolase CwlJ-like protein
MSIIRKAVCALVVLSVLAFQSVSHAETQGLEGQSLVVATNSFVDGTRDRVNGIVTAIATPVVDLKELQCLARNIFFEAASEPEEGKVAVGLVTLNRAGDSRFGRTICGVVDQKMTRSFSRDVVVEKRSLWSTTREVQQVWQQVSICQFSWRCTSVKGPKNTDERWAESQRIARDLLEDKYSFFDYRAKYADALYFHAANVRPPWAKRMEHVGRVGGHHFYQEKGSSQQVSYR